MRLHCPYDLFAQLVTVESVLYGLDLYVFSEGSIGPQPGSWVPAKYQRDWLAWAVFLFLL